MTLPISTLLQGTVIVNGGLMIRTLPTVKGNTPIGRMVRGTKVVADRKQDGWWHLTSVNGTPVTEESWSFEGDSNEYIRPDVQESLPLPITGRTFAYVYRNFERPGVGVSRPTEKRIRAIHVGGLPDTCKLIDSRYVSLTHDWQEWWFCLLGRSAPHLSIADLKHAWSGLIQGDRAFTNFHGPQNGYADYINNINSKKEPAKFEPIITGGNVVEVIGGPIRKAGKLCWMIRAIDATKAPPDIDLVNRRKDPYVVFAATDSCRRDYDKNKNRWLREHVEEPFPQLKGSEVPVPLLSLQGYNFIETCRVRIMKPGEAVPYPYCNG